MDITSQTPSNSHILQITSKLRLLRCLINIKPFISESNRSDAKIITNQRVDGQVKLSQLPLRRIRSDGAVLCDGAGHGVERTEKGAEGGCVWG